MELEYSCLTVYHSRGNGSWEKGGKDEETKASRDSRLYSEHQTIYTLDSEGQDYSAQSQRQATCGRQAAYGQKVFSQQGI